MTVTAAGIDERRLRRLGRAGGLLVLNLHNVGPSRPRFARPIPPRVFEELVVWLTQHCRLTTFAELHQPGPEDERPLAILSFDDGYSDFLEYAMPILARHQVRANQNVIPACVDSGRPPWNVELLDALEQAPIERLRSLRLPVGMLPPPVSEDELMRWGVALSRILKLRPRAEREPLLDEVRAQLEIGSDAIAQSMLSSRDLREIMSVHEIGAHSYEHDSMGYETDEFFAADVRRCNEWFCERLGHKPTVYAFPNGSYRATQIPIAQRAGIENVLLVDESTSLPRARIHPRVTADGITLRELRMRLARAC